MEDEIDRRGPDDVNERWSGGALWTTWLADDEVDGRGEGRTVRRRDDD